MKKKIIAIVAGLLAVAAVAVWAFWPKGAEPQHGELFLQEFQRFIEPLCQGEADQYEILDKSGQDITEQVKQAVQKDVEKGNWDQAAQTAFSMADSMMYRHALTPDGARVRFLISFANKAAPKEGEGEDCKILWMLETTLEQDESGLFVEADTSEVSISGEQIWPKGRIRDSGMGCEISHDRKSAVLFGNLTIVGDESEEMVYENIHSEAVLRPLAQ